MTADLAQLKLKRPCRYCPFSRNPQRIRFACRERAEEIEEHAYRHGFPCHESAEERDGFDGETFFEFGPGTQHCAGSIFLRINAGESEWPALDNEELPAEYLDRVAPYLAEGWADDEEFLDNAVEARRR